MDIVETPFGGIFVKTKKGNFAVNAGGTMEEMDSAYIQEGEVLKAMLLTTEHCHRLKNASSFVEKHGIPLIGSFIAFAKKKIQLPERWDVFLPRTVVFDSVSIEMFHVHYDSIDPFALIFSEGNDSAGVVPDGKLTEKWDSAITKLASCNQIYFGNVRFSIPDKPEYLRKRYSNNYNTATEIERLFCGYNGKLIYPGNMKND